MEQHINNNHAMYSSNSDSSSTDDDDDIVDLMLVRYLMSHNKDFIEKISCMTSMFSGKAYILEVLVGNPSRCYEGFRMAPHVFRNLCDRMKMLRLLKDQRDVSVEEGVAMRLAILYHGTRQRIVAERFQHSLGTVHKWSKRVIRALATFGNQLIKYIDRGVVQLEIYNNPRWYPYFKVFVKLIFLTHLYILC